MSKTRRSFGPEFKAQIVLELLKGEKDVNQLAAEHNILPNQIRNWKAEFVERAAIIFDEKRDENLRKKLDEERSEKEKYERKIGQLTMQVDWLKKKAEELLGPGFEDRSSAKP